MGVGRMRGALGPKMTCVKEEKMGAYVKEVIRIHHIGGRDERKEGAGTALMEAQLRVFWGSD